MVKLLSAKAAAKELGISTGKLHLYCRERRIRYTTVNGKSRMFRLEWLDEFIDSRMVPPVEQASAADHLASPSSRSKKHGSQPKDSREDWDEFRRT
jgi:hypothetical protein